MPKERWNVWKLVMIGVIIVEMQSHTCCFHQNTLMVMRLYPRFLWFVPNWTFNAKCSYVECTSIPQIVPFQKLLHAP
jgi:hypothetical protein